MTGVLKIRRNLDSDMHILRESPWENSFKMQPSSSHGERGLKRN
jgi:hypothetical protein